MKFPLQAIIHLLLPLYVSPGGGGGGGSSPLSASDIEDAAAELQAKEDETVKKMCLPTEEFMKRLQSEGERDKKSKEQLLTFPDMKKLAKQYYSLWSKLKLDGLDQNRTRCENKLVGVLVKMRRHVDVHQVDAELQQYAFDGAEKMYVLSNDDNGGQEIFTRNVLKKWCTFTVTKAAQRNPSVATRAMAAFCLPKHRAAMSHYLSGKWYRGDLDQCSPTDKALAEDVLQDFKDENLAIYRPAYMDNDDHDPEHKIDPYKCAYEDRDATWLIETWTKYVQPKLKKVLKKWYKETGGGSRDPENFVNYCESGDTWLAGIYAMDMKSDFILSSVAAGTPPSFLRMEAGFEVEVDDHDPSSFETPKQRKAQLESVMEDGSKNMSSLLSVLKESMEKRKGLNHLEAINKIREHKRALEDDDDFDDEMKQSMLESMKRMKHAFAKEMIEDSNK